MSFNFDRNAAFYFSFFLIIMPGIALILDIANVGVGTPLFAYLAALSGVAMLGFTQYPDEPKMFGRVRVRRSACLHSVDGNCFDAVVDAVTAAS